MIYTFKLPNYYPISFLILTFILILIALQDHPPCLLYPKKKPFFKLFY